MVIESMKMHLYFAKAQIFKAIDVLFGQSVIFQMFNDTFVSYLRDKTASFKFIENRHLFLQKSKNGEYYLWILKKQKRSAWKRKKSLPFKELRSEYDADRRKQDDRAYKAYRDAENYERTEITYRKERTEK